MGGIGANRANPGRYWYANLIMGAHVLEQSRLHEVEKLVVVGTVCSYPKFTPVPFREDELWNGFPEETNAPYGVAKKAVLVGAQAYRDQYGLRSALPAAGEPLRARRQLPRDIARDPRPDPEDAREPDEIVLWGDGSPTREFLYVDDCVDGLALAAERYDGREPVNLGTGDEIPIRDLAEPSPMSPASRADPVGHVDAERSARRRSTPRGPRSCSASSADVAAGRPRAHSRLVPLARAGACGRLSSFGGCSSVPAS